MEGMQGFLGQPGVGLVEMLIIGGLAGWIAGMMAGSRHGIFTNVLVGIAGAFVGGKLAEVFQIPILGFWRLLIAAIIGAIIVLLIWRAVVPARHSPR
jgi:uncharacterized membrane protein YeaQ/YmgE (transglycosylase-associated protein family)